MKNEFDKYCIVMHCLELAVVVAIMVVALSVFATGDALQVAAAFTFAIALPVLVFRRSRHYSAWGELFLLVAAIVMTMMAISHIWMVTEGVGRPLSLPLLQSDDNRYFNCAMYYYDGSVPEPKNSFPGFPLIMMVLWKVFGVSIVWPLAMNVMLTLLAFYYTGKTAITLLEGKTNARATTVMWLTLLMCCGLMFLMSQSARLLKEALSYISIALVGYALTLLARRSRLQWGGYAAFVVGCLIMAVVRTTYIHFFFVGVIIVALGNIKRRWRPASAMLVIAVLAFVGGSSIAYYIISPHVFFTRADLMNRSFAIDGMQQPYLLLISDYFSKPFYERVFYLPLTMSVQYIIPFPWVYDKGEGVNVLELFTRMRWMWYAVGGISLYYYLFISWHRGEGIGVWALWPAAVFAIVALLIGGTVSRYILPIELLFVPQAAFVILKLREGEYRKSFVMWSIFYLVVLTSTLLVCHNVQTSYLNNLEDYYRRIEAGQ